MLYVSTNSISMPEASNWAVIIMLVVPWLLLFILGVYLWMKSKSGKANNLEDFFEISQDMLCIADSKSAFFYKVNSSWRKNLGYKNLTGQSFLDLVHPDDKEKTIKAMSELSSQKPVINFTNRFRHYDGSYRYLEWQSSPRGNFIFGSARDITHRIEQEASLKKSETRYRLLFENMTSGFALHEMIYDDQKKPYDYRFLEINPAFERLTGISAESALNRTVRDFLPQESLKWINLYARVVETGNPEMFQEASPQLGRIFNILAFSSEKDKFATIFTDITQQIEMQEKLKQSEKLEAIGLLAGGIAHDFNNQLCAIQGFTELLDSEITDKTQKDYLEHILESVNNSSGLIKQLLAFARKGESKLVPLEIGSLIKSVIDILTRSIDKKIEIRLIQPEKKLWMTGDAAQIQNAFLNLGINAREAMPEGGVLTYRIKEVELKEKTFQSTIGGGRYIETTVIDTGKGMNQETQRHAFEPFFTTKSKEKGIGLGLAAVYGTIQNHKGAITLQSEVNAGTTIKVYFPLHQ